MRERLAVAAKLMRTDRAVLRDYAGWYWTGRKHKPMTVRVAQPGTVDLDEAIGMLTATFGEWTAGPALECLREWNVSDDARRGGGANMGGDSGLGAFSYAAVRACRPDAVIETGVATGVTSAHILAALEDNGCGVLHSIDLPPTGMVSAGTVGAAIPAALKERWSYHWGSARRLLPPLLRELGGRRVFVHDSDHSYKHMSWEIETAWANLGRGDLIVCDDVDLHSAFLDTSRRLGGTPMLVAQAEKAGTTGFLIR